MDDGSTFLGHEEATHKNAKVDLDVDGNPSKSRLLKHTHTVSDKIINGFKGKTFEEQVEHYKEIVTQGKFQAEELMNIVERVFNKGNLKNRLWNAMQWERKKWSPEMQETWDSLMQQKDSIAITLEKNKILALSVGYGRDWEKRAAEESRSFSKKKGKETTTEWKYAGEMKQIHGAEEFEEFKACGKWDTKEDDDGHIMYRKKRVVESRTTTLEDQAKIKGDSEVNAADYKALGEGMVNQFKNFGSGSSGDDKTYGENSGAASSGSVRAGRGGNGGRRGGGKAHGRGGRQAIKDTPPETRTPEEKAMQEAKDEAKDMLKLMNKRVEQLRKLERATKKIPEAKALSSKAGKLVDVVEDKLEKLQEKYDSESVTPEALKALVHGSFRAMEEAKLRCKQGKGYVS